MKTKRTISKPDFIGNFDMKRNLIWLLTGLMLISLLGVTSISLAGGDTWVKKADMPTARNSFAAAVVDGKIYTFGGRVALNDGLQTVEAYDPVADKWVKKSDMPTGRRGSAAVVVGKKIYVIGGLAGSPYLPAIAESAAVVEVYDPATDTWTKKADMPNPRGFLTAEIVDGKIYLFGGWAKGAPTAIVEEYDPVTDKWTTKAPMPLQTSHGASGMVGKQIYVVEGIHGILGRVYEYNPLADSWTRKADMPTRRHSFAISTVKGVLYVIGGGVIVGPPPTGAVEAYDAATDTWTRKAEMPTARGSLATAVVDGRIYALGGTTLFWAPEGVLQTVEEYTPEGWEPTSVSPRGKLTTTWGEVKRSG